MIEEIKLYDRVTVFTAEMPQLKQQYTFQLRAADWRFLRAFIEWMLTDFNDPEYTLELTTLLEIGRRFRNNFYEPKDRKITLRSNETIALKRMLWIPAIDNQEQNNCRNHIFGLIDQQTIGIK